MNENSKTVSRNELYDHVWTTPITILSKQYDFQMWGSQKYVKNKTADHTLGKTSFDVADVFSE